MIHVINPRSCLSEAISRLTYLGLLHLLLIFWGLKQQSIGRMVSFFMYIHPKVERIWERPSWLKLIYLRQNQFQSNSVCKTLSSIYCKYHIPYSHLRSPFHSHILLVQSPYNWLHAWDSWGSLFFLLGIRKMSIELKTETRFNSARFEVEYGPRQTFIQGISLVN